MARGAGRRVQDHGHIVCGRRVILPLMSAGRSSARRAAEGVEASTSRFGKLCRGAQDESRGRRKDASRARTSQSVKDMF